MLRRALSVLHKVAPIASQQEPLAVDVSTSTSVRIFVPATLSIQLGVIQPTGADVALLLLLLLLPLLFVDAAHDSVSSFSAC